MAWCMASRRAALSSSSIRASGSSTHREPYGHTGGTSACPPTRPDGKVYALLSKAILRHHARHFPAREAGGLPGRITAGGALVNGLLCFASGPRLWSYVCRGCRACHRFSLMPEGIDRSDLTTGSNAKIRELLRDVLQREQMMRLYQIRMQVRPVEGHIYEQLLFPTSRGRGSTTGSRARRRRPRPPAFGAGLIVRLARAKTGIASTGRTSSRRITPRNPDSDKRALASRSEIA